MTTTDGTLETLRAGYGAQLEGNLQQAEQLYRKALALEPANARALILLGMLCQQAGRLDEAIDHLRRASELSPRSAGVLVDLGNTQAAVGRYAEAIASYEAALEIQPNSAEYWTNLAAAHCDSKNSDKGLRAIECALHLNPDLVPAWSVKADLLLAYGRPAEAVGWYRRYLERHPDDVPTLLSMANALRESDDAQAGLATLQRVLDRHPEHPQALFILGRLREQSGDLDGAKQSFQQVLRLAPGMTQAHYQLAQIRGHRVTDDQLAAMESEWKKGGQTAAERVYLAFGLYRALEQRSRYDEAFDYLEQGNRLNSEGILYDDVDVAKWMDNAVAGTETAIARLGRDAGDPDTRPVFVVGMLRSGTTLTEQILASHSQVAAAGEVGHVGKMKQLLRQMTGTPFPGSVDRVSTEQLRELGRYYVSLHTEANLRHRYVVDKTPTNHEDIGLLALALPHARFIHCHRDPVASCFAIYRMPFDPQQSYSHDMTALGRHYCLYWNLMQRWHALFPGRILDVRYEDTVADLERQSRRLLEFLDLPFEQDVLKYYATERAVRTPSASQVRQPIYSDAVESWKHYEHRLGPLLEALQPVLPKSA